MTTIDKIIRSEVIKAVLSARFDTAWYLLDYKKTKGDYPDIGSEKAKGILDDKGAIIGPGGFIYRNYDRKPIQYKPTGPMKPKEFRERIKENLQHHDGATLLFHDGIASDVNLHTPDLSMLASQILTYRNVIIKEMSDGSRISEIPPEEIDAERIITNSNPSYFSPPFGTRLPPASCFAVCVMEPGLYQAACRFVYGLSSEEDQKMHQQIFSSCKPIKSEGGTVLAYPCVIACYSTRKAEEQITGSTIIGGYGKKLGEFMSMSLEEATERLLSELGEDKTDFEKEEIIAEYGGVKAVCVVREYLNLENPTTSLISPYDIGLNPEKIARDAKKRHNIEL